MRVCVGIPYANTRLEKVAFGLLSVPSLTLVLPCALVSLPFFSFTGDDSWHGTSAVDYRVEKDMRLAATIYIADVRESNVDSIMKDYTQAYPPRDHDLLLSWAGRHWRRDDPNHRLPLPELDHVLLQPAVVS